MDYSGYLGLLVCVICLDVVFSAPSWQKLPVCRSYSKLCRVSFEIDFGMGMTFPASSSDICACPKGLGPCPSVDDPNKVIQMQLMSAGQNFQVTMNYCGRQFVPRRTCKKGQLAAIFRGSGPILFEMEGDLKCKCPGPLYLSSAKPAKNGESIRQYTCGQPTCSVNRSTPPVCERTLPSEFPGEFVSEVLCRCPDDFECSSNSMSIFGSPDRPTDFSCHPIMLHK